MFAANFWVKNLGHNLLRDHLILTKISFFTEKYDLTFEHFLAKKNALMDTLTYSALVGTSPPPSRISSSSPSPSPSHPFSVSSSLVTLVALVTNQPKNILQDRAWNGKKIGEITFLTHWPPPSTVFGGITHSFHCPLHSKVSIIAPQRIRIVY